MTDAARDRRELHQALADQLGERPADTLMAHLPDQPTPDFATRDDLLANTIMLRGEMAELRSELRGEMAELRSELRGEMAELKVSLQRFVVTTILAGNTALAVLIITAFGVITGLS
ncbi:MAG: hypothetical protein AAGF02_12585 [Actinomycetota bacterium]